MSHSDNAIRSAIVALGSTGEKLHTCNILTLRQERFGRHLDFTRVQYGKALRHLQRKIDDDAQGLVAYAILLCFLFCIFEFLQGNDSASLVHLRGGLALLSQAGSSISSGFEALSPGGHLDHEIKNVFSAMNAQATLWLGLDVIPIATMLLPQPVQPVEPPRNTQVENCNHPSTAFASVDEASEALNRHMSHFYAFRVSIAAYDERSPASPLLENLIAEKKNLILQFQQWPSASEAMTTALGDTLTDDMLDRLATMTMNWTVSNILLHTYLVESNPVYRKYELDFRQVLELASSILRPMNDLVRLKIQRIVTANNGGINPAAFSLHAGIIAPIYYTAIKCRNLKICRDALALLKEDPWREGAFDSLIMATIAEPRIQRHQEEGYYEPDLEPESLSV
ncbi:MAG: hypothetical protein Q9195_003508 [Heterodermia aff. obscurata]